MRGQATAMGKAVEQLLVEAVMDLLAERPHERDADACLASYIETHGPAFLEAFLADENSGGDAEDDRLPAALRGLSLAEQCGAADTPVRLHLCVCWTPCPQPGMT